VRSGKRGDVGHEVSILIRLDDEDRAGHYALPNAAYHSGRLIAATLFAPSLALAVYAVKKTAFGSPFLAAMISARASASA
jgi:hypothetical protein